MGVLSRQEIRTKIIERADLSIGQDFVERTGAIARDFPTDTQKSNKWIHSKEKVQFEKMFLRFLTLALPLPYLAQAIVYLADGSPTIYEHTTGLLGEDEIVSPVLIRKIRTLKVESAELEDKNNEMPSAFRASRQINTTADSRTHSIVGVLLRETALDETPQIPNYLRGTQRVFGPRGYTVRELMWIQVLLSDEELKSRLPENFPHDYQKIISNVRPSQGALSLRNALFQRGELTVTERLMTDYEFTCRDSVQLDWKIFRLAVERSLRTSLPNARRASV